MEKAASPAIDQAATPKNILNSEREFLVEELFFSITDKTSRLLFVNDVFVRISGYEEGELLGKLHNIIRHPHMPRCAFKIMWERLEKGLPMCAYVKNLAKDGKYYWVMALIFQCERGYFSIRLKPASEMIKTVESLYQGLLATEKEMSGKTSISDAMQISEAELLSSLKSLGFVDYEDFMCRSLEIEMRARIKALGKSRRSALNSGYQRQPVLKGLAEIEYWMNRMFCDLEQVSRLGIELDRHTDYIIGMVRSIKLHSFNAEIGALRMGTSKDTLGVVADNMAQQAELSENILAELKTDVAKFKGQLGGIDFLIISTALMSEMACIFAKEFYGSKSQEGVSSWQVGQELAELEMNKETGLEAREALKMLIEGLGPNIEKTRGNVREIPRGIRKLQDKIRRLERLIQILRISYFSGKVESALCENGAAYMETSQQLIQEVEEAAEKLRDLSDQLQENRDKSSKMSSAMGSVHQKMNELSLLFAE